MDLEAWLYKLFLSSGGQDFAGRRLIEIYRERLGGGPHVETAFSAPGPASKAGVQPEWMQRAGKAAAKIIIEGPDDVRFKALDVLSHVHDPDLAGGLLKRATYLKVPGHQVMAIVGASGSLVPEHAVHLEKLAESASPDVCAAAVLAMAFTDDASLLAEIEGHYFSTAPEVRASAVLATGLLMARTGVGVDHGVTEPIMTLLRTRQWRVTYQATILTLGVMGGEDAAAQLMNFIASRGRIGEPESKKNKVTAGESGSLTMRLALLALAAGSFEGPDVTDALVDGCWSDVEEVREMAGYALLLEASDPGVVLRFLPSHIPVDPQMKLGRFKLEGIMASLVSTPGYAYDLGTLEALRPSLEASLDARLSMHSTVKSMDNDAVDDLIETLAILDASEQAPSLLPFTDHVSSVDEGAARQLLSGIVSAHLPELDVVLSSVLTGPAANRDFALVGLASLMGKIGGTTPPASLVELATGADSPQLASAAIQALGSFDSGGTVAVLKDLLSASTWSLRVEIVGALGHMGCAEAKALLEAVAAKDRSGAVREAAAAAI
jgi:HEAT repeat protein